MDYGLVASKNLTPRDFMGNNGCNLAMNGHHKDPTGLLQRATTETIYVGQRVWEELKMTYFSPTGRGAVPSLDTCTNFPFEGQISGKIREFTGCESMCPASV
jgi:hypothetical protein